MFYYHTRFIIRFLKYRLIIKYRTPQSVTPVDCCVVKSFFIRMQFITISIIKSVVHGASRCLALAQSRCTGFRVSTPHDLCNEDLHWTRDHLEQNNARIEAPRPRLLYLIVPHIDFYVFLRDNGLTQFSVFYDARRQQRSSHYFRVLGVRYQPCDLLYASRHRP